MQPLAGAKVEILYRAGAEFEVLEAMVHDSSLLLVDAIDVKWNDVFRPEFLEWPAMYSQVGVRHC